jgi:hypothetical protein
VSSPDDCSLTRVTYLLAHKGIPIIEMAVLDALAKDRVYAFASVGRSLKLLGASAAPIRPVAIAFGE